MLVEAVERALERMKTNQVYAVLVHHADDLAKPGWEFVVEALDEMRARGFAERLGVSIYDREQLALACDHMRVELVQLPFNVLDRSLAKDGVLSGLKTKGIEVHARSVFLQGLLLMQPDRLPTYFAPLRGVMTELQSNWTGRGLTPLAACLNFVLRQKEIDVAVVGVNSCAELLEIEAAVLAASEAAPDVDPAFSVPSEYLNPARWPRFAA